ncbi:MAG: ATP-binding protein [Fusobacterium varium]|uniref:hypothetical protein n=1 Tax=Fusobacterium varium TaxID=856 RepID=UPI00242BB7BE|nr:hypothetical protein [Fusobacterium varium]MCF0171834.1 ATP-binding protein [Fusobacterium varium]
MNTVKIGKNVLENLTLGMYENKYTIFREYIQNSADSIDKAIREKILEKEEAQINIEINSKKRYIKVYDNAMGISKEIFKAILSSIADSEKDYEKDKGFRGIGRLAGLAYCKKMIFRSSYLGEKVISEMIWNGELLKEILTNKNIRIPASEVIEKITYYSEKMGKEEEHFFEVILEDITLENDDLLDTNKVITYLNEVSPVPYKNNFIYSSIIYEFVEKNNLKIDEYRILVNDTELFKPYTTKLYELTKDGKRKSYDEIKNIEIKTFYNDNGKLIAWMWIGICSFNKKIPFLNQMRGIRLRKENIQIGSSETLNKFFKEERGNGYYIGEIFVVEPEIIPNGRRDYFIPSQETNQFEYLIEEFFYQGLYSYYHYANKTKNALKKEEEYQNAVREYIENDKTSSFISKEAKEKAEKELEEKKEKAEKAKRELENRKKENENDSIKKKIYDIIIENSVKSSKIDESYVGKDKFILNNENLTNRKENKNKLYLTQNLSKYNKAERKLIGKIYEIINNVVTKDVSELLIKKIQEELRK